MYLATHNALGNSECLLECPSDFALHHRFSCVVPLHRHRTRLRHSCFAAPRVMGVPPVTNPQYHAPPDAGQGIQQRYGQIGNELPPCKGVGEEFRSHGYGLTRFLSRTDNHSNDQYGRLQMSRLCAALVCIKRATKKFLEQSGKSRFNVPIVFSVCSAHLTSIILMELFRSRQGMIILFSLCLSITRWTRLYRVCLTSHVDNFPSTFSVRGFSSLESCLSVLDTHIRGSCLVLV